MKNPSPEPWFFKLAKTIFDDGMFRYLIAPVEVPDRLYHYTSISGLAGMINSANKDLKIGRAPFSTLWLTNLRTLNDDQEGLSLITPAIRRVAKICGLPEGQVTSNGILWSGNYVGNSFVMSFTTKKDDLALWKAYGGVSEGVCLGFDFSEYLLGQEDANMVKVSYIGDQDSIINDEEFWSMINLKFVSYRKESTLSDVEYAEIFSSTVIAFLTVLHAPSCKDSFHSFENEFRILATTDFKGLVSKEHDDQVEFGDIAPFELFVEAKDAFLVERMILQSPTKLSPLKEVLLSPAGPNEKNKDSVALSLSRLGVSADVSLSAIRVSR